MYYCRMTHSEILLKKLCENVFLHNLLYQPIHGREWINLTNMSVVIGNNLSVLILISVLISRNQFSNKLNEFEDSTYKNNVVQKC
jgi:hypothetical protein